MADATVASIQTGSLTTATGDGVSSDVTITSVDTSRSILMFTSRSSHGSTRTNRHVYRGVILNGTTLRFTRAESAFAGSVDIEWTVIEFDSGVIENIQTGQSDRTAAQTDITITAVDLSKTFVLHSYSTDDTNTLDHVLYTAELTSTTNLRLESSDIPSAGDCIVEYQVVEFADGVSVQHIAVNMANSVTSGTQSITSVDTTKTFIINQGTRGGINTAPEVRAPVILTLDDATTVGWERSDQGSTLEADFTAAVVELTGSSQSVEHGTYTIADGNTTPTSQPSWTALSTDKTAVMANHGSPNRRGSNDAETSNGNIDDVMASIALDAGADGVTVERSESTGDMKGSYFVADWTGGGASTVPLILQLHGS